MCKVFVAKIAGHLDRRLQEALDFVDWHRHIAPGARVFIKPNFPYPHYKPGVTTSPPFLDALLGILKTRTTNITVGESDGGYRGWPAEMAFRGHDAYDICTRHGARLVNLSKLPREAMSLPAGRGQAEIHLPALLLHEVDVFITAPVPKIHAITRFSGALKNQWGCIPDNMRIRHHPVFDDGILALNRALKTRLVVADGTYMLDHSGLMFGNSVPMDLLLVSDSIAAHDLIACEVMRVNPWKVKDLRTARDAGMIPPRQQVTLNQDPSLLGDRTFRLDRTLRNGL